jgi:uncharacterized protein YgiM (DUF1202 family)
MMRRAAIALAGVLAFGLVPAASAQASAEMAGTTEVNKDNAPIRNGPGWNYDLIAHGDKGDQFRWECQTIGSDWMSMWLYGEYKDGHKGWIDIRNVTEWDVNWPYCVR